MHHEPALSETRTEEVTPQTEEPTPSQLEAENETPATDEEIKVARPGGRVNRETANLLNLYLREIATVNLLTPKEEIELAAKIQAGDKDARELMIKANLRLVIKIARRYEGLGMPLLDLISEGNIGLMTAVERFDPTKGAKLSTYACWWIKQSMRRALADQAKTIRLPVHMVGKICNLHRTAQRLHETLGREPTDEDLSEELGISTYKVAQMRMAATRPASLDAPLGDDDCHSLSDVIHDETAESPAQMFQASARTGMLQKLVNNLNPREATLVRARFGLDGSTPKTLDEVGQEFGVTRERARQLQGNALRKLRKMLVRLEGLQN
jgi:RNA polymerase primary sigma factor